ncbi:putative Fe-S cluster-containing radical SAM superfamily protein [Rhizobium binae]|uniref:Fe-S cluster-containing radical SAM superfamily protein n=1 Tax=Rhizobium binae TaxID=1138190 RepID=A0ABV2MRM5_9HYPH|nr:hypothetical protein [Rhizobium binae]MBX4994615.1 hypothetical protein [Rhizobium binae]NKL52275.1 hypothetical protein [Rhizobium leguminosarum bv. viciae]QSY84756.1 hypothetical protein J2J99_22140 [Rhizobium binae]
MAFPLWMLSYYSNIIESCLFYWNNVSSAIKDELSMGHAEKTRSRARGDSFGGAAFSIGSGRTTGCVLTARLAQDSRSKGRGDFAEAKEVAQRLLEDFPTGSFPG